MSSLVRIETFPLKGDIAFAFETGLDNLAEMFRGECQRVECKAIEKLANIFEYLRRNFLPLTFAKMKHGHLPRPEPAKVASQLLRVPQRHPLR